MSFEFWTNPWPFLHPLSFDQGVQCQQKARAHSRGAGRGPGSKPLNFQSDAIMLHPAAELIKPTLVGRIQASEKVCFIDVYSVLIQINTFGGPARILWGSLAHEMA